MFKEFNKEFYRSLNFYLMILLFLGSIGEWLNKGPSLWLALLLFATVGTTRSAFWSKEWTLKANWQIYLCIAFLLVGAWVEFLFKSWEWERTRLSQKSSYSTPRTVD